MGKKKTEDVRVTTEVDGREVDITDQINAVGESEPDRDDIQAEHDEMIRKLVSLEQQREFYQSKAGDEFRERILSELKERVEDCREENITPGTKGSVREQNVGRVAAYRETIMLIEGRSWDEDIKKLERDLKQFEKDNALFLQPETVAEAAEA